VATAFADVYGDLQADGVRLAWHLTSDRGCRGHRETTGDDGVTMTHTILEQSDDRMLVRSVPDLGAYSSYTVVEQRGDVVTLVDYFPGETREAHDRGRRIADATRATLDDARCCP
jgi:hypothetical protein